ncbi:uncharacterized protein LOC116262075 isoform X2 [Nymphaea colorata]|uniref:uncharacterized protein LOC116262075 isoform X2 n=1 Tax=Nymphaea colorata TaxID=210225 RepID=UPI00214EE13D|nr:uncharacterized protein LOC116262075 isoform X2 [Nymphaea colorata]
MGEKRKRQSSPSVSNVRGVTGSEMGTCIIDGENLSSFLELLGSFCQGNRIGKAFKGSSSRKDLDEGVNDTTRVLERMPRAKDIPECSMPSESKNESSVQLQALLVASDCGSKWLIKHFPSLAYSRGVPLISIADNKAGSLRLGEVVKLKTAIAIGVKANGSGINKFVTNFLERRCLTGQGGE